MPKGTRVSRCVDKVKKSKDEGAAIAICQASTNQGYATGKALKEALKTQFGSKGSKLSKTSSRHTTNPGESKAEARADAKKFTKKHGQQASQTHTQTGKIPGPKPGLQAESENPVNLHELLSTIAKGVAAGAAVGAGKRLARKSDKQKGKDFQKGKMEAEQEGIEEAVPLVAMAGKAIGSQLLRRGAVVAGRKAAQGSVRRGAAKAARKAAKNPKVVGAMGTAAEKGFEALKAQRASDKDLEETKMNNAYVRRLMEDEEPTDKDLEDIKKEKPTKIPKKKYFGGETDPKKVDTQAAIASHRAGIKAAGKKGVADLKKERQAAGVDDWTEYHTIGALMAEALGLTEGETTGSDVEKTAERVGKALGKNPSQEKMSQAGRIGAKVTARAKARGEKGLAQSHPDASTTIHRSPEARFGKAKRRGQAQAESRSIYHQIGRIIAETEFPKGPTAKAYEPKGRAKDTGEGQGTASIKDPLVRKETEKTKANIDKKTQSDTNPKVSDLVQGSMNRRRGESRRGQGPSGLGKESRADAKADAARDKYRRMAPGDK